MKHEKEIVFPAITLCNYLSDQQKYPDEFIYGMTLNYKSIIPGDFLFRLNMTKFGNSGLYKCIRINGGKNLTGHSTKLMKTNEVSYGLTLSYPYEWNLKFPRDRFLI